MFPRIQPDSLRPLITERIRRGDILLCNFVIIHGNAAQRGGPVRAGGYFLPVAAVNALNLERGIGNYFACGSVPLLDGQVRQLFVCGGDGDNAAARNIRLIHMDTHVLVHLCVPLRGADLHKRVCSGIHIRNCNLSGVVGRFRGDQLPVAENIEDCAGKRIVRLIQFYKAHFHFRVIFKHQLDAGILRVNPESLHAGVQGVASRSGNLPCPVGTKPHFFPIHIFQIAGSVGGILAVERVVDALDGDDRSLKALCGIVLVHFPDFPAGRCVRRVGENFGDAGLSIAGQDHVFRTGVVDLVAARRSGLRHGVGSCGESFQFRSSLRAAGGYIPLQAGTQLLNVERGSRQRHIALRVHFLHNQRIIRRVRRCTRNLADHNALHRVGGVGGTARACKAVLVYLRAAPGIGSQQEDIIRDLIKRFVQALRMAVDVGVVFTFQTVVHPHQFLRAVLHRIAQSPLLIPPDHRLNPCVHIVGERIIPYVIDARGDGLIGKDAQRMGIIVGHEHLDRGIGNLCGIAPGLSNQGAAHTPAVVTAEARGSAVIVKLHVVDRGGSQPAGMIAGPGKVTVGQPDAFTAVRQSCRGKESQQHYENQQQAQPPFQESGLPENSIHSQFQSFPFCK